MKQEVLTRSRQGSFDRPAISVDATLECANFYPQPLRPFDHAKRCAVVCQYTIVALVSALLFLIGPAAVVWFVVPIDVWESVDGISALRHRSHIGIEGLEAVEPAIADGNSTATVDRIVFVVWISAAPLHSLPAVVLASVRQSVGSTACDGVFSLKTSAGLCISVPKLSLVHVNDNATRTLALPSPSTTKRIDFPNDFELSDCRSSKSEQRKPAAAGRASSAEKRTVCDKPGCSALALAQQVSASAAQFSIPNDDPKSKCSANVVFHSEIVAEHNPLVHGAI